MNNGGPAFPTAYTVQSVFGDVVTEFVDGMTMRDHFASKAMQGLIPLETEYENRSPSGTAREAYEYADAMLAAREGGEDD